MASRKHVDDFLFLSRVLERRMGRFSSSVGDSGCSSSDSTTLASPFCLESARRWQRPISSDKPTGRGAWGGQKGFLRPCKEAEDQIADDPEQHPQIQVLIPAWTC